MGGARNFAHFAAESTLSFLTKRQVKMWFLMDRDERNDEEIAKITARLGDRAVVKFLNKREIENYLVNSRVVTEYLVMKLKVTGMGGRVILNEAEVKQNIDVCAEKLKQYAIDKRVAKFLCKPMYPNNESLFSEGQESSIVDRGVEEINRMVIKLEEAKSKAVSIFQEQTEIVNVNWSRDKLSLVPGDILLDMVFKEYGFRFKKERDGYRLAAIMKEKEIDSEIKDIIRSVGSS